VPPLLLLALGVGAYFMWKRYGTENVTAYDSSTGEPTGIQVRGIGNGASLRLDCASAWDAMVDAATEVGLDLQCSGPNAGYRTDEMQAALQAKLGKYGQGGFAADPGHSPHQTGTAVDILNLNPATGNYDAALATWIHANCASFGFSPAGDSFSTKEPWHFQWSPGVWSPPEVA
jgi:LAS superfamily LD-carboxypeptidase LdcB